MLVEFVHNKAFYYISLSIEVCHGVSYLYFVAFVAVPFSFVFFGG